MSQVIVAYTFMSTAVITKYATGSSLAAVVAASAAGFLHLVSPLPSVTGYKRPTEEEA